MILPKGSPEINIDEINKIISIEINNHSQKVVIHNSDINDYKIN